MTLDRLDWLGGLELTVHLPILYVVSDSLGETAEFVAKAAAIQFNGSAAIIRRVAHVHDVPTIDETLDHAKLNHGVVAFTIVVPELKQHLLKRSAELQIPVVDVLTPMLEAMEIAMGRPPQNKAGLLHQLDADYFRRMEAIEFAVKSDDGRGTTHSIVAADLILIGVSRTSKTPLSMYLAHKSLKVMNLPLVPEVSPPKELFLPENRRKIIGLTIRPDNLHLIRKERLRAMGLMLEATYASHERIVDELEFAAVTMQRLGCPVVDVSDRAVEETAGMILEYITRGGRL